MILTIHPYRYRDGWVFDDSGRGLREEALVEGADTLLDLLVAPWEKADGRAIVSVSLRFAEEFGPYQLMRVGPRNGGTDYVVEGPCGHLSGHKVWLCPALEQYFHAPPDRIGFSVVPWEYGPAAGSS